MARLNKRDYIHIAILISLYIIFVFFLTRSTYVYGSMTDWAQQHWVFPEYFRNLFYANHDLFPSFACNLGGGQNIFNFSYYGLYSPIMLGVLMSSVLILPAFAAILNGRDAANSGKALNYLSLILPKLSLDKIVYNPYSMGLTT